MDLPQHQPASTAPSGTGTGTPNRPNHPDDPLTPGSATGDDLNSVRQRLALLQRACIMTIAALIVFSGAVNALLLWQVRVVRGELAAIRPVANRMLTEYETVSAPRIQMFFDRLAEFSEQNPDFASILGRYIQPATNNSAMPPVQQLQRLQPLPAEDTNAAPDPAP